LEKLQSLVSILQEEIKSSEQLAMLSKKDARLGYHPDAEGYTYFPEKLRWRTQQLQNVLQNDVPEIQQSIEKNELLFPEYTGREPRGAIAYASHTDIEFSKYNWQSCEFGSVDKSIKWAASYDADALTILIKNTSTDKSTFAPVTALIKIEPRRLWPGKLFIHELRFDDDHPATIRIPFERIGFNTEDLHPIRLDVRIQMDNGETAAWRPNNPLLPRLLLGSDNPADLGWLFFR
jgi:hypothetical protein